ncbi:MAG: hypothetical protein JXR05_06930 [Flavobacteriaceae bacterium]
MQNPSVFSTAITIDFLITIPLVYFLIIRKRKIPKITVLTTFVLGMVILTFALPEGNQSLLSLVKTYFLPILELGIIGFIIYKVRSIRKAYKSQEKTEDFYTALLRATNEVLPKKVASVLVTEISVAYYGFIHWRKVQLKENEFSYHEKSTVNSIVISFLMIILIETLALHFLLQKWSVIAAWILTGLSIYTALQFFALARSISKRPIKIDEKKNELILRFGFFSEWSVSISDLKEVELSAKDLPEDKSVAMFAPLGSLLEHNVILHFNEEQLFSGIYGLKRKAKSLAIYVDEKGDFKRVLEEQLKSLYADKHQNLDS